MARSIVQEPVGSTPKVPVITNFTPIVPYVVLQDDISGKFYFKWIMEVRYTDSSGVLIAKVKQRRNGYQADVDNSPERARTIFDVRNIVNSILEDTIVDQNATTKTIHKLGDNVAAKIFSTNYNQLFHIYVKFYEEYATSADDIPAATPSSYLQDDRYYIAASLPLETTRGTSDFQNDAFNKYTQDSGTDYFLSDTPFMYNTMSDTSGKRLVNYVQETDYHTVGFLNQESVFDSECKFFEIVYYTSAGSKINEKMYIENNVTNGGWVPTTDVSIENKHRLLYFGCGPANLEGSSVNATDTGGTSSGKAKPSNNSGWSWYSVRGCTTNDETTTAYMTYPYYFVKQEPNCKGYKVRRLAWRNSKGCYDYFNFTQKSVQTVEINRNDYSSIMGSFDDTMYTYSNVDRGKQTRQTEATLTEVLNTDFINDDQATLLESLMVSTNVQIVDNDDTTFTVPVTITDKKFERKTIANDTLIQYSITIEYANPINTNS